MKHEKTNKEDVIINAVVYSVLVSFILVYVLVLALSYCCACRRREEEKSPEEILERLETEIYSRAVPLEMQQYSRQAEQARRPVVRHRSRLYKMSCMARKREASADRQLHEAHELHNAYLGIDTLSEMCPVCLEEFIQGEQIVVLHCRHSYHYECISGWVYSQRTTCPMCRQDI